MIKKILICILFMTFYANSHAQNPLWSKTSEGKTKMLAKMDRAAIPTAFQLFSLDFTALKTQLLAAPLDTQGYSDVVMSFPNPKGELKSYRIFEAPVMEAGLAAKFPDNKSYIGKGIDDPTTSIRFSTTLFGLHVMAVSGEEGTFYIDTYTKDLNNYIVYSRKDLSGGRAFACDVVDDGERLSGEYLNSVLAKATDSKFRTYRMAMACTIEYAAFHVAAAGVGSGTTAQKKAAVLAAMNVTVTRLNAVYEKDMSLRMVLVANNDLIIFITSDSFTNDDASALINESQTVIDGAIGSANYDIGHTVSTGGGGLAQRPSVCINGSKARGITGSPAPVGDPYDIDFVAHEVGHQFGGNHTFNGIGGNCTTGTRSSTTAVEVGSGSTIMAYAGICTGVDVQGNSDAYFHAISLAEMFTHVTGTGNCAASINNANTPPVANAGADYSIPNGTAFVLTGSATDANGDALTYCWEQTDTTISTQPPVATATGGPNFRSITPTSSPSRSFPRIQDVLNGNLAPTWEVVPAGLAANRTMNFALTVRDNRSPNGGQTARDNMTVTFRTGAAFAVTSQNTDGIVWTPATTQTITWNVAATAGLPYNLANVRILLSTDGGLTYPTVLLATTANDGTENITVPSISQPNCRIRVEPIGNIFFAVNSKNIAIGNYVYQPQNICNDYTFNLNSAITESSDTSYPGMSLTIADSFTITDANFYANVTHPNIGQFNILIKAPWQAALNTAVWYNNLACTGANLDKWFDTAGAVVNCADNTNSSFANAFKPFSTTNINAYNGNNSAGSWLVYFKDTVVDANVGSALFSTFKIQLCYSQSVPVLANQNFGLEGFAIYPNPNNGNFNIQFTSNSGNAIKVGVHDMGGRLIFESEYQKTGMFNQNLQLNGVQSGIYMVTVQDGDRKEVNKIVIN